MDGWSGRRTDGPTDQTTWKKLIQFNAVTQFFHHVFHLLFGFPIPSIPPHLPFSVTQKGDKDLRVKKGRKIIFAEFKKEKKIKTTTTTTGKIFCHDWHVFDLATKRKISWETKWLK